MICGWDKKVNQKIFALKSPPDRVLVYITLIRMVTDSLITYSVLGLVLRMLMGYLIPLTSGI